MKTKCSCRRLFLVAVATLGPWAWGCADDSKPETPPKEIKNPDYNLSIVLNKEVVVGDPIALKCVLKNTGVKEIPVLRAAPLRIYEFEIINQGNKQRVGLTKRGEDLLKISQEGSMSGKRLKPGEEATSQIENLAEIFELGSPGEYSILVMRQVFSQADPKQIITISAPKLVFKVVPKE